MHIGLMVTGTIMWWPLLSPLPEMPRLAYPAQTLYLFLLLIPMAAVSAPITLAPRSSTRGIWKARIPGA